MLMRWILTTNMDHIKISEHVSDDFLESFLNLIAFFFCLWKECQVDGIMSGTGTGFYKRGGV